MKKALHIMHELNIRRMQFRSQEPRICSLGAESHHLAHASVYMTLARQASVNGRKSARLEDCSKVKPTIAAPCFPPACLVEAGSRGVGDRPVATFSTGARAGVHSRQSKGTLSEHTIIYDVVVRGLVRWFGVRMRRICRMAFLSLVWTTRVRVQLIGASFADRVSRNSGRCGRYTE